VPREFEVMMNELSAVVYFVTADSAEEAVDMVYDGDCLEDWREIVLVEHTETREVHDNEAE